MTQVFIRIGDDVRGFEFPTRSQAIAFTIDCDERGVEWAIAETEEEEHHD